MIDSVVLVWGHAIGTAERRVRRVAEPVSPPIRLDMRELVDRLGSDDGQVRSIRYGEAQPVFGHWKVGDVELLYRDGRLELRASLPKLLTGRNDVVLDERGVHDGLREFVRAGEELAGCALELREAVPTRLDYAYQWDVPSVAFILEHVKAAFAPARKLRTEHVNAAKGGRSLVFGYGTRRVLRFYDKVGELAARGEESQFELDTLLRYEIQERQRGRLRLVHEQGYRGSDVRDELTRGVQLLGAVAMRDVEMLLAEANNEWPYGLAYALAALHLAEHDELWPVVRRVVSRNIYYAWRGRARQAALAVGTWTPEIAPDAFTSGSSLWTSEPAVAA